MVGSPCPAKKRLENMSVLSELASTLGSVQGHVEHG